MCVLEPSLGPLQEHWVLLAADPSSAPRWTFVAFCYPHPYQCAEHPSRSEAPFLQLVKCRNPHLLQLDMKNEL